MRYHGVVMAESPVFTAEPDDHLCSSECKDAVFPSHDCYEQDDEIHLTFENCAARNDDRIAIYPFTSSSDEEVLEDEEALLWMDACMTVDCMGDTISDTVGFGSSEGRHLIQGSEAWPLPPGEYVAALVRMGEGGLHGRKVALTEEFSVLDEGELCDPEEEEL